ncbi:hypothetical protein [uncultured Dialister sp.]|uniref:hypothetical protein n=1 Tax=uncultured Dialister sp. TaxID=278064 RepID=UPI00265E880A|nr:hypothetical protein [uncultured Dialister sp.]
MKYRMKAALLAICVSACSAFGFSVYAEGSQAAAAVSDQKAEAGVNHSAEKKQGGEAHSLFPISGKTLSAFDFSVGGVSLGDSISSLSSQGTAEKVIHENTTDSYVFKDMTVKRTSPFLLSYSHRSDLPEDFKFPGKGISEIDVSGAGAKTPRGIGVGSSREDVLRAYGRPLMVLWDGRGKSFHFRYGSGLQEMDVTLTGDKVSSIRLASLTSPVKRGDVSYDSGEGLLYLGDRDFKVAGYELGSTFQAHPFEEWEKKMANPKEEILYFPGYAVHLTVKSSLISALFLTDNRMVTSRGLSLGDDVSTVDLLYGKPHRVEMNVSGSEPKTSYIYFSKGKSDVLIINFSKNKVEGIVNAMNPTK